MERRSQIQSGCAISRTRQPFDEVRQIGNKDTAALTAPRAGDIGCLGIHFLGSQDDGRLRATLGLVAGDHIAVAEVTKLGSYDGSFTSVNRAVGVELRDRDDTNRSSSPCGDRCAE